MEALLMTMGIAFIAAALYFWQMTLLFLAVVAVIGGLIGLAVAFPFLWLVYLIILGINIVRYLSD